MPRSAAPAARRLRAAALELFHRQGYTDTTVAEIAVLAAVTPRTFFRHFPDKREVLFADATDLAAAARAAVEAAPDGTDPWALADRALRAVGGVLEPDRTALRIRAAVIEANPALLERDLAKQQQLTEGLAALLHERTADPGLAALVAAVAGAVFRVTYAQWLTSAPEDSLPGRLRLALRQVHP